MPLKLYPPRKSRSPNYSIRGTYLGEYVDRTSGTPVEATAKQILAAIKRDIERGRTSEPVAPEKLELTFEQAALDYIKSGGDTQYLGRYDPKAKAWTGGVIPELMGKPLSTITQQVIDQCAVTLYPLASAATRNRHVYTPVSAVLKYAGRDFKIKRPKGWRGNQRVTWMEPKEAFAMLAEAKAEDAEFGIFLAFLLYTGCRLNGGLALTCDRLSLTDGLCYLPQTKNEDPRGVHLPPFLVAELANHPRGLGRGKQRVFRFRKCGRLYTLMGKVKERVGPAVTDVTFHIFCHTWATWMRRYGGADISALLGTGRWRDAKSARRYEHVIASEESRRADLLPTPENKSGKFSTDFPPNRALGSADVLRTAPKGRKAIVR